jgi:hypothetical protein
VPKVPAVELVEGHWGMRGASAWARESTSLGW